MTRIATTTLATLLALGGATLAAAQDNPGPRAAKPARERAAGKDLDSLFSRFDRNGDGAITRDEFPKPERFDALDADRDGKLTKEELQTRLGEAAGQKIAAARLKQLDTDGDGKVSKAEYEAAFAKLDRDGDGFLTEEEMAGAFTAAREARTGKERRDGKEARPKAATPGGSPPGE